MGALDFEHFRLTACLYVLLGPYEPSLSNQQDSAILVDYLANSQDQRAE